MDDQVTNACGLPRHRFHDRNAALRCRITQLLFVWGRGWHVPQPHRVDPQPVQHGRQARGVVPVRVGLDHQVQVTYPSTLQPVRDLGRVRATINQDARPTALHQDGVTLPHVDDGDGQGHGVRPWNGRQHDQSECRRGHPDTGWHAPAASRHPHDHPGSHDQQPGPSQRHDGQVRHSGRCQHDPECRIRQAQDPRCRRDVHGGHQGADRPDHPGQRRCRHGHQVGRHRRQRHLAERDQQDRRRGNLRTDGHGHQ